MANIHELIVKIGGQVSSNVNSSFNRIVTAASKSEKSLQRLNNVKLKYDHFEQLQQQVKKMEASFPAAENRLNELSSAFYKSKAKSDALQNSYQLAKEKADRLSLSVAGTIKPTKELMAQQKLAKETARQLGEKYKIASKETGQLQRSFENSKSSLEGMKSKIGEQKKELDGLSASLNKAGFHTDKFTKEQRKFDRLQKSTEKLHQSKGKFKDSISKTKENARSTLTKGAIFAGMVALPAKAAIDMESTDAEIAKVANFKDNNQKTQILEELKRITREDVAMPYSELGNLAAAGAQGGIKTEELSEFAKMSAKMAVAFDIEGGEAGDNAAKWKAAFGMKNLDQVREIADQINYLGNNSAASAPEISQVISKVGALGGVAGLDGGSIAALSATMIGQGVQTDVAGTGVKKLMTTLAGGGKNKGLTSLGFNMGNLAKGMSKDGSGTILKVLEKIKSLPKAQQAGKITEIFGQENVAAIAPLLSNLDLLKTNLQMVGDKTKYAGSMEQEFQTQNATTAKQLTMVKENLGQAGAAIGTELLPFIQDGSKKLVEIIQKVKEFQKENPVLFSQLTKLGFGLAALPTAVSGVKTMYSTFTSVKDGVTLVKDGVVNLKDKGLMLNSPFIKLLSVVKSIGLFFVANPWTLALGAVAIAAFFVYKNFDKIKAGVSYLWMEGTKKFEDLRTRAQEFGDAVREKIGSALEWIRTKIESVKEKFEGVANFFGLGGKKSAPSTSPGVGRIPEFASGGVVSRAQLALIGEGGDREAVIPLNNRRRSAALWRYAGEEMGLLQKGEQKLRSLTADKSSSGNIININFAIDAKGASPGVEQEIRRSLTQATPEIRKMIKDVLADMDLDHRRRIFA